MADNVELNLGTGGAIVAADDVSGAHYQRVKLTDGAADSNTPIHSGNGTATNALRVTFAVDTALPGGTNNIGDVDVLTLPTLPAGDNNIGNVDIVTLPALPAGSNNIGDVDVLTLPALPAGSNNIGDVDVLTLPALPAGTNNIGDVDVLSLPAIPAGTNFIGEVRHTPSLSRISVTPTISTSVYASGDVVGGQMTFANAARISGGSGTILSIVVLDKTQAQRAAMDLLFFDRSVTVAADNAAVAMSDADMANCLGVISIGPYNTAWPGTPANSIATLINVGLPFVLNGTDLFVAAVVRATPTYVATSDLVFILTVMRD